MKSWVISSHGSYLTLHRGVFQLKEGEKKVEVSPSEVDEILILSSCSLSTRVIREAVTRGITLAFLDTRGAIWGLLLPSVASETVKTKKAQYRAVMEGGGKGYGEEIIRAKIGNQEAHLKYWARRGERVDRELGEDEASAARVYWGNISLLFPQFKGRDHDSGDQLNVALNYSYAVVYSRVMRFLVLAGLDPYLGFVHRDRPGSESLVYDFSEMFKPYVDLILVRAFREGFRIQVKEGLMDGESRGRLAKLVVKGLEDKVKEVGDHNPKTVTQAMRAHAVELASCVREGRKYRGFRMVV